MGIIRRCAAEVFGCALPVYQAAIAVLVAKSVFAKVVGRYTENETTKDVIIVITRAAAEAIGVIDKRFFVNIGYGIPTNEK